MTLAQLETELKRLLPDALEVRHILLAKFSSTDLIAHAEREVAPEIVTLLSDWTRRRATGFPLAYLTGVRGFYKYEFSVEPGVLIPRPETELAVETALRRRPHTVRKMADLGCGSGCLGLSVLAELEGAHLIAIDSSPVAAKVTAQNAKKLGLFSRVDVVETTVERWSRPEAFDLVVMNPPYIAEGDRDVDASVHQFEPHAALYSGRSGLDAITSWTSWSGQNLLPGGLLVCEIGTGQSARVRDIMASQGFERIEIEKDLAGHDRVVSAIKRGK